MIYATVVLYRDNHVDIDNNTMITIHSSGQYVFPFSYIYTIFTPRVIYLSLRVPCFCVHCARTLLPLPFRPKFTRYIMRARVCMQRRLLCHKSVIKLKLLRERYARVIETVSRTANGFKPICSRTDNIDNWQNFYHNSIWDGF